MLIGGLSQPPRTAQEFRPGRGYRVAVRGLPESPRRRKRVLIAGSAAGVALVAALVGLHFKNTAEPQKETFEQGQAQVTPDQVLKKLTPADRRAVLAVVERFVRAGVAGKDLAGAYDLTTANLHAGVTREQWVRGDNPIYRYPVFKHGVRIAASYENDVLVQLYVRARTRKVEPLGVDVEVKAVGKGPSRRWLVDYFQPREALVTAADRPATGPQPKDPGIGPHLTQRWLFVPLGVFLLILLVPVGLGIRHWAEARAAERAFGEGRELPPLPRPRREN
jgi:hypothetical protein